MYYICANKNSKEKNEYVFFNLPPIRCKHIDIDRKNIDLSLMINRSYIISDKEEGDTWILTNVLDGKGIISYDEMLYYCGKEITWEDEPYILESF